MYLKPEPAIYKIENEQTGDFYIGGTRNVQARKRNHWYDLRKSRHRNPRLQEAHNLGNTFSFSVLEYLEESFTDDMIVRREQEWMEFLNPSDNGRNAIQKFGSDLELQKERKLAGGQEGISNLKRKRIEGQNQLGPITHQGDAQRNMRIFGQRLLSWLS